MDASGLKLPAEQLRWRCDEDCFSFQCTDELIPLQEFIGQDRAIRAIEFGLGVDQPGYNIFVAGLTGTGKSTVVKKYLESVVKERADDTKKVRYDWCYIHNFADESRPRILRLGPGMGRQFKARVARLRDELKTSFEETYGGEEYEQRRKQIVEEKQGASREILQKLDEEARTKGFTVQFSPQGVAVIPLKPDGTPANQEDVLALPEESRRQMDETRAEVAKQVQETLEDVRDIDHDVGEAVSALNRQVAEGAAGRVFDHMAGDGMPRQTLGRRRCALERGPVSKE